MRLFNWPVTVLLLGTFTMITFSCEQDSRRRYDTQKLFCKTTDSEKVESLIGHSVRKGIYELCFPGGNR